MKKNIKLAAAFGLLAFATVSAQAADMIVDQAPEPQPIDVVPSESTGWAGPYAGIYGGYTFGETSTVGLDVDHDGFSGGAFLGYTGQSGAIVYGLEGDLGYNGSDGVNGGLATESGIEGSLRARLGYAVNDRFLVYATAGGAAEQLEATAGGVSDKQTMLGYTVGAGVDAKLTEQVFARAEYRYTDYGSENFAVGGGTSIDSSSNKIHLGLGLKF